MVVAVETTVTEDTRALVPMDEEIVQGGAQAAMAVNLREAKAVDPVQPVVLHPMMALLSVGTTTAVNQMHPAVHSPHAPMVVRGIGEDLLQKLPAVTSPNDMIVAPMMVAPQGPVKADLSDPTIGVQQAQMMAGLPVHQKGHQTARATTAVRTSPRSSQPNQPKRERVLEDSLASEKKTRKKFGLRIAPL